MATTKQRRVAKILLENTGKSVSSAMREAGYPEATAKNPQQLTRSQGWQELMIDHLSDEGLAKAHEELLNQTKTEYFTFPKTMQDEEIEIKVNAAGLELIVIQDGEKGRYAFYAVIDAQARKSALDMAYKLKGSYAAEKSQSLNLTVEARLEDKDDLNAIREKFDNELKAKLLQ